MSKRHARPASRSWERLVRSVMLLTLSSVTRRLVAEFEAWKKNAPDEASKAEKGFFLAVSRLDMLILGIKEKEEQL